MRKAIICNVCWDILRIRWWEYLTELLEWQESEAKP
jgi:hypothetical protein